uniref:Uncharacterized protein n=2 Tax=Hemiselmis andersenii TaxID=464988 RepID=A0A6U4IV86_HEMAN
MRAMDGMWSLCQSVRGPIYRPNTAREEQTITQLRTARSMRESERTATVRSAYSRYLTEDFAKRSSQGQEAENERALAREYLRVRAHKVFTEHVPERMARSHDPQIHIARDGPPSARKESVPDAKKQRRRSSQVA